MKQLSTFLFFMIVTMSFTLAQESYIRLAFEYYNKGEYQKAVEYFEELSKDDDNLNKVYDRYLDALIKLNEEKKSRQLLKKVIRKNPKNINYRIDQVFLERNFGNQEKFESELDALMKNYVAENSNLRVFSNNLMKKREYQLAEKLYLYGREEQKNNSAYVHELLTIYRASGNENGVIEESLNLIKSNSQNMNYAQNVLQAFINEDNYQKLESRLIKLMQRDSKGVFNEMLIWTYIQVKEFELAFLQSKALDRRFDLMGSELVKLGSICFKNEEYQTAIEIYQYVIDKYPKSINYAISKQRLIETREEVVKKTHPVSIAQIKVLIQDYQSLILELGKKRSTADAVRKMALLHAFYLNDHDTAISLLEQAIEIPRVDKNFIGTCKLSLGDIYLLKNQPWESVLLYAQVDKSYKASTIGHEAKLRSAKLYFYQGDFELAQSNLDILKLATSREIANDALDLSLLIQDNLALDTSSDALQAFAKIELLVFQKLYSKAINKYESFLENFQAHSLTDEVYLNMANIYSKLGEYERAIEYYDNIISLYSKDIYGDDAYFKKALILEDKLNRKEEAMDLYKKILFEFPGSIYNAEARKRFRQLRGDYIN